MLPENSHWLVNVEPKFQLCKKERETQGDFYLLSICSLLTSVFEIFLKATYIYTEEMP